MDFYIGQTLILLDSLWYQKAMSLVQTAQVLQKKDLLFLLCVSLVKILTFCVCGSFPLGFEGRMWNFIV